MLNDMLAAASFLAVTAVSPIVSTVLSSTFTSTESQIKSGLPKVEQILVLQHDEPVKCVAYLLNGKRLVTISGHSFTIWDLDTGKPVIKKTAATDDIEGLAVSSDGMTFATASWDNVCRVWNSENGAEKKELGGLGKRAISVAITQDSKKAIAGTDAGGLQGFAKVWDVETGRGLFTIRGLKDNIQAVAFSNDGSRIFTGSWGGEARIHDASTGDVIKTLEGLDGGMYVAASFSHDGSYLAAMESQAVVDLYDAKSLKRIRLLKSTKQMTSHCSFSPDSKFIICGTSGSEQDGKILIWKVTDTEPFFTFQAHGKGVLSSAFSPDGTQIATGSLDKTVKIWRLTLP